MMPSNEPNIYPKSDENLKALISFYFDIFDIDKKDALEKLKEKDFLSLNQCEFILRKLSEAYKPVFTKNLNGEIKLTNLIAYGIDALHNEEISRNGSRNRQRITKEFKKFSSPQCLNSEAL